MKLLRSLVCILSLCFGLMSSLAYASTTIEDCKKTLEPGVRLAAFVIDLAQKGDITDQALEFLASSESTPQRVGKVLSIALSGKPILADHLLNEYQQLNNTQSGFFKSRISRYFSLQKEKALEKSRVEAETADLIDLIDFVTIQRGSVQIPFAENREKKYRTVSMQNDLEVMTTHVTMKMFKSLVKLDPAVASDDQPDFPTFRSTIWMAMLFANKLSEEYGYTPVYDLPALHWNEEWGTIFTVQAEDLHGVVKEKSDESAKPNGFRLPTINEWEFILGSIEEVLQLDEGFNVIRLRDGYFNQRYLWSDNNSIFQHHAVATRAPFTVQGEELFDLYGLAKHWMHPVGPELNFDSAPYMNTGSVLSRYTNFVSNASKELEGPNGGNAHVTDIGFRLVREVGP